VIEGRNIAIIGAGVAGLATAIALARNGAQVTVYERARAIREVGAGLQISPNGFAVLHALGLGDAIKDAGVQNQAVVLHDHHGASVLHMDLARAGYNHPFVLIHRARLISVLEDAARAANVRIELGQAVTVDQVDADLVVGADGLHSATRRTLNGDAPAQFSGQVAWRMIIADDAPAQSHVYMGPGCHLVTYPLGCGQRNIVAVQERADWAEEGWHHEDDPEAVRSAFKAFAPGVRRWLDLADKVMIWGLFLHPVADTWHSDRVALVGDAAHPTLPFMAQGANLALEDAWVLADCLSRHPQVDALHRYQALRKNRVRRAIAAAQGNARNFHIRNPVLRFAAHSALRISASVLPNAPLRRLNWLYGCDVTSADQREG